MVTESKHTYKPMPELVAIAKKTQKKLDAIKNRQYKAQARNNKACSEHRADMWMLMIEVRRQLKKYVKGRIRGKGLTVQATAWTDQGTMVARIIVKTSYNEMINMAVSQTFVELKDLDGLIKTTREYLKAIGAIK